MNAFDEKYIIRMADINDIDNIMKFIQNEWGAETILATNKECFCFQYQKGDKINFIIAINKDTKEIESISGFVQYSEKLLDIGPAVWLSKPKTTLPFLGVEVMYRMVELTNCRFWGAPGSNHISTPIFDKVFKQKTGTLRHFYMLSDVMDFKIAIVNHAPQKRKSEKSYGTLMIKMNNILELEKYFDFEYDIGRIPYKDRWFFDNRYFNHPVYNYIVWVLKNDKHKNNGVLVGREVFHMGSKVLKIIDFLGCVDLISELSGALYDILHSERYEYIDIYCEGIPSEILINAGFCLRDEKDMNIIPNYFEPFLQENVDIKYNGNLEQAFYFRGDSDRDRPYIWIPKLEPGHK